MPSQEAENARMAKLYSEHVLGEKPVEGLVSLDSIAPAAPSPKRKKKKANSSPATEVHWHLGSLNHEGRPRLRTAFVFPAHDRNNSVF